MSNEDPKVYLATYSNTDVFESIINDNPLMRRCKDNWVNATQILKCLNFPKAKRTKILEKGVQQGLHEKIQGGYGRFQGTWIPLQDAQRLAATYSMTPDMAPVLFFDPSDPSVELHKKTKELNKDGTPVKRKYIKKKKPDGTTPKKMKLEDASMHDFNPTDSFNSVSRMPSHLSQYSNGSNIPLQYPIGNSFNQQEYIPASQNMAFNQGQPIPQDYQNYQLQVQMQMQMQQQQQQQQQLPQAAQPYNYTYPSQGSQGPVNPHQHMLGLFHHNKGPSSQSTNETNWSQEETKESDTSMSSNEEMKNKKESYSAQLLRFFSEENGTVSIPYFIQNPPFDFNINEAIDDEGHTPLHWASSIGNYTMIHLLIQKGANPLVVNNYGLNPLSKLVSFNNCYDQKNFPKVLDDLEICLINTDINGRTPLHYLCQFSKVHSKYESLRYYLGIILNKLTSMTNQNSGNRSINLLKNVLDHQDVNGDTCLHLASKAGSVKLVKLLLSYNARDDLFNVSQESAKYLIMKSDLLRKDSSPADVSRESDLIGEPVKASFTTKQLSTPTQPSRFSLETPDTQKTTVQEDDDDDRNVARVNKEHINQLLNSTAEDDKENIFLDSMKPFDSMSTPIQAHKTSSYSAVQPTLAVISERTAENTPAAVASATEQVFCEPLSRESTVSYHINPPKVEQGVLIEEIASTDELKLPVPDVKSMMQTLVDSLTGTYEKTLKELKVKELTIKENISIKEVTNENIMNKAVFDLSKIGLEDFKSLEQADKLLEQFKELQDSFVKSKETSLTNTLEKSQAYQLANLVSAKEKDNSVDMDSNSINDDEKLDLAIELTELQITRSTLLNKLTEKIKCYGIDDKMYKYRKLISLSCGLKVDEIDGLIDGIEESLIESNKA